MMIRHLLQLPRRLDSRQSAQPGSVHVCVCAFVGELCAPLQDSDTPWNNVRVPDNHAWTSGKEFAIWFVAGSLQFLACMTGLSLFGGHLVK